MARSPSSLAKERLLGGLQTLEIAGHPDGMVVVLLHGYGADAYDLLPLADVLPVPAGTTWLFPHGPHEVAIGPHMTGRAWFPIDLAAIQMAMMAGRPRDLSQDAPPELIQSASRVESMLREAGLPFERTVLAGFSQGAMTATSLALRGREAPAGLAILSGALIDAAAWRTLVARRPLDFMMSHGELDPILPIAGAKQLEHLLRSNGWRGALHSFRGGHEIPHSALQQLAGYLAFTAGKLGLS